MFIRRDYCNYMNKPSMNRDENNKTADTRENILTNLFIEIETTSTIVRNLTVLSSTTYKINRIRNHFWIGGDMNM